MSGALNFLETRKSLEAEIDRDLNQAIRRIRRRNRNLAEKGYSHKVVAWIHPVEGGDDYRIEYLVNVPEGMTARKFREYIQDDLERRGSAVTDDYVLTNLRTGRMVG